VMPLKLWRPRAFDGVALVLGSAAPDLFYVVRARPLPTYGHTWAGLLLWCVPLCVVIAPLIRRSAPVVAAHLPGWWRDYGVLGKVRHRWYVTVMSAWVGAVTHNLWDEVTHDRLPGTSLGFEALGSPLLPGMPWAKVLHLASSAVGLAVWVLATVHIGRRGLLRQWHGPAPQVTRRPRVFWTVVTAAVAVGTVASALLPYADHPMVFTMRMICLPACALMAAAFVVHLRAPGRRGPLGSRDDDQESGIGSSL
jgi:hypothetical protein